MNVACSNASIKNVSVFRSDNTASISNVSSFTTTKHPSTSVITLRGIFNTESIKKSSFIVPFNILSTSVVTCLTNLASIVNVFLTANLASTVKVSVLT